MAIAPGSVTNFSLPPGDEPLGIQQPLGLSMGMGQGWLQPKFMTPLGTRSLAVLDPSIFLSAQEPTSDWRSPFEDSPFFDAPEAPIAETFSSPTSSPSSPAASPPQFSVPERVAPESIAPEGVIARFSDNVLPISAPVEASDRSDDTRPTLTSADDATVPSLVSPAPEIQASSQEAELSETPSLAAEMLLSNYTEFPEPARPETSESSSSSAIKPYQSSVPPRASTPALPSNSAGSTVAPIAHPPQTEIAPPTIHLSSQPDLADPEAQSSLSFPESAIDQPAEVLQSSVNFSELALPESATERSATDELTADGSATVPQPEALSSESAIALSAVDSPVLQKESPIASESPSIATPSAPAIVRSLSSEAVSSVSPLSEPVSQEPINDDSSTPTLATKADFSSSGVESSAADLEEVVFPEKATQPFLVESPITVEEQSLIASTKAENTPEAIEVSGNQSSSLSSVVQRTELVPESPEPDSPGPDSSKLSIPATLSSEQPSKVAHLKQITDPSSDQLSVQPSVAKASELSTGLEAPASAESQFSELPTDAEPPLLNQSPSGELRSPPLDQPSIIAPEPSSQILQPFQFGVEPQIQTALNSDDTSVAAQPTEKNQPIDSDAQLSSVVQRVELVQPLDTTVSDSPTSLETPTASEPQLPTQPTNPETLDQSSQTEPLSPTFNQPPVIAPEPSSQIPKPSEFSSETTQIQTALNPDITSAIAQSPEINQPLELEIPTVQLQAIADTIPLTATEQKPDSATPSTQTGLTEQNPASTISPSDSPSEISVLDSFNLYLNQPGETQQPLIQSKPEEVQAKLESSLPNAVEISSPSSNQSQTEPAPESLQPQIEPALKTTQETIQAQTESLVAPEAAVTGISPSAATEPTSAERATELPELPTVLQKLSVWEPLAQTSLINAASAPLSSPAQPAPSSGVPSVQAQWGGDRSSSASIPPREQSQSGTLESESAGPTGWSNIAELFQTSAEPHPETQTPEVSSANGYADLNLYPESQMVAEEEVQRDSIQADTLPETSHVPVPNDPAQDGQTSAAQTEKSSASPEQLERLAQEIYRLVRQRLVLERERGGHPYSGRLL